MRTQSIQWFSLQAAVSGAIVIAVLFFLTIAAATGIDLIGW